MFNRPVTNNMFVNINDLEVEVYEFTEDELSMMAKCLVPKGET